MFHEVHGLFETVQAFTAFNDEDAVRELLGRLEKFKARLQNICKNTAKSATDRSNLRSDSEQEVNGSKLMLTDDICAESKIISDIFNMNEWDALQIVLAGELQMSNFCGLNRGLIAVICYYDSHRFLARTLRILLSWNRDDISEQLKDFIELNFITSPVFKHLIQLQGTFSVASEFALLSQPDVNGLGGTRHQHSLRSLIEDISESGAEALYSICSWASDKAKEFASDLYPILKNVPTSEKLSNVHLTTWCALIRLTSSEVLGQATTTSSVLSDMIREIRDETAWSDQSVCGTVQLACAIAIRAMAVSPADHLNITNVEVDVDKIVDRSVLNCSLKFIRHGIIGSDNFNMCASHFKIVDTLFKQLISHFPGKLMEIERNSEDELMYVDQMAEKGQQVATVANYCAFIGCITDLYYAIDHEKTPIEVRQQVIEMSADFGNMMELQRFVERSRVNSHAVHAVAYLEMLRAVCRTSVTAAVLFDLFAQVPANEVNYVGWEHVMCALRSYERMFREQKPVIQHFGSQPNAPTVTPVIPPQELAGLISWINLARTIAEQDVNLANSFVENRSWLLVDAATGVISSPVPLPLKGALLKLLGALAAGEATASRIWSSLHHYQICSFADNGALLGLQQELEERECTSKQFDSSLGFSYLMRALLAHGTIPDFSGPYLQYLTKSIVAQMASRSYNDVNQLWELAEVSLDALVQILKRSYIEARAVARKEAHIQLLVQILNDTPVYRAICAILLEDCDVYQNPGSSHRTRLSQKAALSALRLLSVAVSKHAQLRAVVRKANSDVILANLQVLLLSPLRNAGDNIMDIAFQYLEQTEDLPSHALAASYLLRDLTAVRPSLQKCMVELMRLRIRTYGGDFGQARAIRLVLNHNNILHTVDNVISTDLDENNAARCRGETARVVLEILSDAVDTDPAGPNLCYMLFGFEHLPSGQLFANEANRTGFHELIAIIEQFDSVDPLNLPFSALMEPAFRLLQRLVSVDGAFSNPVLRYLRASNIIERLISSQALVSSLNEFSGAIIDNNATMFAITRMIAGSILHLTALEISSLLRSGHFDKPSELYHILLDVKERVVHSVTDDSPPTNLLFSILRNGHTILDDEVAYRNLDHFNADKLDRLFENCRTSTVFGISQYDIECLHALLKREILSTGNDETSVAMVEREMGSVLEYCTDLNSQLLLRGAADSLVSGCTALLNVIAVCCPVPFFSFGCQLDVLCDASFALVEFVSSCSGESIVSVCETLHRLCQAFCKLAQEEHQDIHELRDVISRMFAPLVEVILQTGGRPLQAKVSLYDCARLCLRSSYDGLPIEVGAPSATEWMLEGLGPSIMAQRDPIRSIIDEFAYDLSKRIATDIADLPINLKISPLLLVCDLLHEDSKGSKKVASMFSKTGMPRYLTDLLAGLQLDWIVLSRRDEFAVQTHKLFVTLILVLTRLSLADPGWVALSELAVPEVLFHLDVFANPPKQVFLEPATVTQKNTPAYLYTFSIDLVIHLCLSLCSKPKWKRLSLKILDVVYAHRELLSQLLRAEISCSLLDNASRLVRQIFENDETSQPVVDQDAVLKQLCDRSVKGSESTTRRPLMENSFNAPRRLLKDMLPV